MFSENIFKAYDIRGIYGKDFDDELAYKLGRAIVIFLKCKNVVVGKDMRLSSPSLEESLVKGIIDQGADVIKIGLSTTPMMYFAVAKNNYDAGINITASHNPAEYNGFKIVREKAIPVSSQTGLFEIKNIVIKGIFKDPVKKGIVRNEDVLDSYVKNEMSFIDFEKIRKFKIVSDTANAMAGLVIPKLNKVSNFINLFSHLDGNFPNHEANPLKKETLKSLQQRVVSEKADFGIAFDGDADRIFFVDDKGEIVQSDFIAAILSKYILKKKNEAKIAYDLRSSKIVPETIESFGGTPIKTRVGHSFIKELMRKDHVDFAAELSAHYYFYDNYCIESPFLVLFMLMETISETGKTLSELTVPLKKYYSTGEINFVVEDKDKVLNELENEFKDAKIDKIDGLSIEFSDWWFNIRSSNTEPLLRLNLEAASEEKMSLCLKKIRKIIEC